VVFALLAVSLAVVGYDLIHLAQRFIAYVLIVALLVFTVAVIVGSPLAGAAARFRELSDRAFPRAIIRAASYQIAWSIYVSDYSRYLPRDVG